MRARLLVPILLLLAATVLGVAAVNGATAEYDRSISLALQARLPARLHEFLVAVSVPVNEWYGILSAALVVGFVSWRLDRRRGRFVLLAGLAAILVSSAAKWIYERPRPGDPIAVLVPHPASASYPSGHVVWVAGFVGAALYVLFRDRSAHARWMGVGLFLLALALMAVSRVYLGQHFLTDTVGGALLGVGCLTAALAFKHTLNEALNWAEDPRPPRPPA